MQTRTDSAAAWQRLAARTARKVNFGWLLEKLLPLMIGGAVLAFALIFWLRSTGEALGWQQVWPWAVGTGAVAGLVAWISARQQFVTRQQALVRLESQLHLNNALTAASAGLTAWPAVPAQIAILLTLTAVLFFTATTWALGVDGHYSRQDGLVLVAPRAR